MNRTRPPATLRFWLESWLAAVTGATWAATLVRRDWIELLFRVDPDRHGGYLEWLISAALLGTTALVVVLLRHEWRHNPRPLASPARPQKGDARC